MAICMASLLGRVTATAGGASLRARPTMVLRGIASGRGQPAGAARDRRARPRATAARGSSAPGTHRSEWLRALPREPVARAAAVAAQEAASIEREAAAVITGGAAPLSAGVGEQAPEQEAQSTVNSFKNVARVAQASEIIARAVKRANHVPANAKLRSDKARVSNHMARKMDALMKEIGSVIDRYLKTFPRLKTLHPFERELLQLTCGVDNYLRILDNVKSLKSRCSQICKEYAAKCSKADSRQTAMEMQEEGFAKVEAMFNKGAGALVELRRMSSALYQLPQINVLEPTVALVGAPNVGKSSLVNVLSSGKPEICNYPFTTRSIKMGHFYVSGVRHQVTDTPGLLWRDDGDRNTMEMLTLAALEYLPTASLFVTDLTEECGTSVEEQWEIRRELLERYPGKPWIDVFSKADMLEEEYDEVERLEEEDDPMPSPDNIRTAMDYVRLVPDALRVSSLTEEGMEGLKEAIMEMMESPDILANMLMQRQVEEAELNAANAEPDYKPYAGAN